MGDHHLRNEILFSRNGRVYATRETVAAQGSWIAIVNYPSDIKAINQHMDVPRRIRSAAQMISFYVGVL
jgi:hypothetical protein